jgi:protein O-GlcNAc transferase
VLAFRDSVAGRGVNGENGGLGAKEHFLAGNALRGQGRLHEAIQEFRKATELDRWFFEGFANLGIALKEAGESGEAIAAFRRAIEIQPTSGAVWNDLGSVLIILGRPNEASGAFLTAIQFDPKFAPAYFNLAIATCERGDIVRGVGLLRKAVELNPGDSRVHSGLLYTLFFQEGMSKRQLIAEHRAWAARHGDPLKAGWRGFGNSKELGRRLRVGYVSGDFKVHPVGRFILPLFAERDRAGFETFGYSSVQAPDELTAEIRSQTDVWRNIQAMPDDAAAELIRRDEIDILVDLSMHLGVRLGIFARKPAPIQMTYLAYVGTTGLDAVDYRLTDPYLEPPEKLGGELGEDFYEKPIYLRSYWCYKLSIPEEPVGPPPSVKNGFVTFGCLNSFKKIGLAVRGAWMEILRGVPGSRLMIHAHDGGHRKSFLEEFAKGGIGAERIMFAPTRPLAEYLVEYHAIDIALDTFPYEGGTTTCDALWMGVPVVTLAGELGVTRSGVSIMNQIGLTEMIAKGPGEYVKLAVELAGDAGRLAELRGMIRGKMLKSPLMDAKGFAADVERGYREAWGKWCEEEES